MRNRFDSLFWRISRRKTGLHFLEKPQGIGRHSFRFSATDALAQSAPTGAAAARYDADFNAWLKKEIWPEARKAGISQKTLEAALSGLSINWSLPDLVIPGQKPPKEQSQSRAEFSSPGAYFSEKIAGACRHRPLSGRDACRHPSPDRSQIWRARRCRRGDLGPRIRFRPCETAAFGCRCAGDESLYVDPQGDVPHRADRCAEDRRKRRYCGLAHDGVWAGALGQPQFMPSSYLKYAVDFDGDGHRDIWNSVPDALASIANYLSQRGWQRDRDWGFEVSIPGNVSCAQKARILPGR